MLCAYFDIRYWSNIAWLRNLKEKLGKAHREHGWWFEENLQVISNFKLWSTSLEVNQLLFQPFEELEWKDIYVSMSKLKIKCHIWFAKVLEDESQRIVTKIKMWFHWKTNDIVNRFVISVTFFVVEKPIFIFIFEELVII